MTNEHYSLYEWIMMYANNGHTRKVHNLYMRHVIKLVKDGFAVQLISKVVGFPNQYNCSIDWSEAVEGTPAYSYLKIAEQNKEPKLKDKAEQNKAD